MNALRVGLVQLNVSDDPARNLPIVEALIREAAADGACFILTPEVTNFICNSRELLFATLRGEARDETLARLRAVAADLGIYLLIGSLALLAEGDSGARQAVNRSFLIGPVGGVIAKYDKIHMFDVDLDDGESYRESAAYRPGARAVLAPTPWGPLGMTICYDLRFAGLYRRLATAGAAMLAIPAAFTGPTGAAHWEVLLRARAIENGCFVLAPAQTGAHPQADGSLRRTWGHSMVVAPWGEVVAQADEAAGVLLADIDLAQVAAARARVPSLANGCAYDGP